MISAEHIVSILRWHDVGGFGSPFTFSCVMLRFGNEASLMVGESEKYTRKVRDGIKAKLIEMGVTSWRFVRKKNGIDRIVAGTLETLVKDK